MALSVDPLHRRSAPGRSRCWLVLLAWLPLSTTVVQAHGLGMHAAGGWGDSLHTQLGITWDTCVARDHAFNYRLSVARESFDLHRDGWVEHLSGTVMEHTFGLQLAASPGARSWLGPQVLVGVYEEELGTGFGLALGINLHLAEAFSLGFSGGARWMIYSSIYGEDEEETVGYLRVDLLWRAPGDRPPR